MTIKHLICVLALATFGLVTHANTSTTYYSHVTVQAETGKGLVYASYNDAPPADTDYKESMTEDHSSDNSTHTVYLYAKPVDGGDPFKYWIDQDGKISTETEHALEAGTSTKNYTFTAVFGQPVAVTVASSDATLGSVTISNPDNAIGDEVTITATLTEPWAGGMGTKRWSKSHTFDGWYDSEGNLVSTNAKYTFTITKADSYTARFNWVQFLDKPGYYRIRWSYAEQFWSLIGAYNPISSMNDRQFTGVIELNTGYSDPSSIMKISGSKFNTLDNYEIGATIVENLNVSNQGVSTAEIIPDIKTLKVVTAHNIGFYRMTYSLYAIASSEHPTTLLNGYLYATRSKPTDSTNDPDSYFEFEPIDEEHVDQFYFGAEPDATMEHDGGYWTSMYTAFPYRCYEPDGTEAYYISEIRPVTGANIAVLTKIEDGIVPANTAVLLKCKGLTAKENRLIPIMDDIDGITDNLLQGEFQLAQSKDNPDRKTFSSSTMRIFGVNQNGEVGFYNLAEDTELAANRAWLDISGLAEYPVTRIIIRDSTSGITDIANDTVSGDAPNRIFDLQGRPVTNPVKGNIYIIDGVKRVY